MNQKLYTTLVIILITTLACLGEDTANKSNEKRIFYHLTTRDGLSSNSVVAITQDSRGFIWMGTPVGLNRYDGKQVIQYRNEEGNQKSLSSSAIISMLPESNGNLWIGTTEGLNYYDRATDTFQRIYLNGYSEKFTTNNYISAIYKDTDGGLWIATVRGLFYKSDSTKMKFSRILFGDEKTDNSFVKSIYQDQAKNMWIGTMNGLIKLFNQKPAQKRMEYVIYQRNIKNNLSDNDISAITADKLGRLWIGTNKGGLGRFDSDNEKFIPSPSPTWSIAGLIFDKKGQLWIAGPDQLTVMNTSSGESTAFRHDGNNSLSLGSEHTLCVFEDRSGSIWTGNYTGGVSISHLSDTSFQTQKTCFPGSNIATTITGNGNIDLLVGTELGLCQSKLNAGSVSKYSTQITGVKTAIIGRDGDVWVGSSNTGLWQIRDGKPVRTFMRNAKDGSSINSDYIMCLLEDSRNRIWVGTHNGLNLLDRNTGTFTRFNENTPISIKGFVQKIYEDSKQNLWIGTTQGVGRWRHTTNEFKWFQTVSRESMGSYWKNCISDIFEDSRGRLWVATSQGPLKYYDAQNDTLSSIHTSGLPQDITNLIEDNVGNLWLTSNELIYKYDPVNKEIKTYNFYDRIPGYEIIERSAFKNKKGQLFFGTTRGVLHFNPSEVSNNGNPPPLAFTFLKIPNTKTENSQTRNSLLQKRIEDLDEVILNHWENSFTVGFSVLSFVKPISNKYAYKMEGLDDEWTYSDMPYTSFNRLPSGNYTLLVKGANNDGVWNNTPIRIKITLLPPWWRTWWAYCLYACLFSMILFLITRFFWLRVTLTKEKELHRQKLDFFTNVSHEIRSHLMLISGPIEKLLKSEKLNKDVHRQLGNIQDNSARLSGLVKELMDFRKAESANLKLNVTNNDLIPFLKNIFTSFGQLAELRNIESIFVAETAALECWFDTDQFEKTIYNLLSNAYKFTPDHGYVKLEVKIRQERIEIIVTDNGKGIAKENLKKVFLSYFQVYDPGLINMGHGLGLALSKSIIELHKGTLNVVSTQQSKDQEGFTAFTISLQKGKDHFQTDQIADSLKEEEDSFLKENSVALTETSGEKTEKCTILLAENHTEFRNLIRDSLSETYHIITCVNGKEAYNAAIAQIPDVIISDIIMPEMDGLELCKRIKTHETTSHIPIILLTAHDSQEYELKGFKNGADSYISKPFRLEILELRIRNLLSARKAIQQKFSSRILLQPGTEVVVNTREEHFVSTVLKFVEENIDNPQFSVSMLSKHMGMSEPVLYRKVRALLNMTVNNFIKTIRLKKAAKMLKEGLSPAEVSLSVGYADQKYFGREFKKTFGVSPGKWNSTPAQELRED